MEFRFQIQILFLAVFGWILIEGLWNREEWFAEGQDKEASEAWSSNVIKGIWGIILVILAQAILNPYIDKIFAPYHRMWRFFAMVCSLYLYLLVFVFYQNAQDARKLFYYIHPKLGSPVPESFHTYDDDCAVNHTNILDNMDHYFLVHFINWFMAAMILWDAPLLHLWSVIDEILELSA